MCCFGPSWCPVELGLLGTSMYAIFVLALVIFVGYGWARLNRSLYNDSFSPFNLLFYFWIAPLGMCFAELSNLQSGIEASALLVIVLSTAVLSGVSLVPSLLILRKGAEIFGPNLGRRSKVRPAGVLVFYCVTLTAVYFAEFSNRELPLFLYLLGGVSDSNLHTAGKDSKLQVVAFGVYVAAIFVFHLYLTETRTLHRLFYLTLSMAIVGLGLVKASKSDVYIPILCYCGLIYYQYRRSGRPLPQRYKFFALLTVLAVISITSIRLEGVGLDGGYSGLIDFRYSNQLGVVASEGVSIAYGYTALGFQNFSNFVTTHPAEWRVGTSLFRPVLSAFMMGNVADALGVPVDQWNVVSDAANTGTFLTPLYAEGGLLFCLLGALVYATIVNFTYYHFRSRRSLVSLFMYTSLLFPWTWLFFTNAFSVLSIYVNLFYVAAMSWLFVEKKRRLVTQSRAMATHSLDVNSSRG